MPLAQNTMTGRSLSVRRLEDGGVVEARLGLRGIDLADPLPRLSEQLAEIGHRPLFSRWPQ